MTDVPRPSSSAAAAAAAGNLSNPSRFQRPAPPPSSLQINHVTDWNVAIPLLSPLVSPDPPRDQHPQKELPRHHQSSDSDKSLASMVFQKWQHPAAPFCYEPAPMVPPFIPV